MVTKSEAVTEFTKKTGNGVGDIRATFLNYFEKNGHTVVPSSSLVPRNDPTLMFANSGMVQFKNVFVGTETRQYTRAATAQKCVRAGGKHNDLDNVGYTARHHTFFEMLGNFSFGDYFKERAIELAWTLITKEYGLDSKRLLVTVFSEDEQAHSLWKKIAGLSDDRIIRIPTSDNFWRMGDTGPCGPCSEIFYDHDPGGTKGIKGGPPGSADADGDRFIEIWNLVFMQYEERSGTDRIPLPKPSIDTGMGLERIAAVLQGVHDNYDIDLFKALIAASVEATGVPAVGQAVFSHRVIADHLRASCFLIADGVLPSNEGRGYVLRRIMRRAMRHAHLLGSKDELIWRLVPALVRQMGHSYPELVTTEAMIQATLKLEETRFRVMLGRGLTLLGETTLGFNEGDTLPGETAFKLYDTFGFPLDLTQDALRPRGISVDVKGFDVAMANQRAEARKAWRGSGESTTNPVFFEIKERLGGTEFLGYETETSEGKILSILIDEKERDSIGVDQAGHLVVNQTPFYAESGGQVGDQGLIKIGEESIFRVTATEKKLGSLWVHSGHVVRGKFTLGDSVSLEVDHARRSAIRANHSATHLLHSALRNVLGGHVEQKGSLVDSARLRFDFSHSRPISNDELIAIGDQINSIVLQNSPVDTKLMENKEAVAAGAMALFGEKYGDEVRVVSMGVAADSKSSAAYSVELCGGTHVKRTGEIGVVHISSDTAVASGVRRIDALTGETARQYLRAQDVRVRDIAATLKVASSDIVERVESIAEERRKLDRLVNELKHQLALTRPLSDTAAQGDSGIPEFERVGQIQVLARTITGISLKELRSIVDAGKATIKSGIVAIAGIADDGKAGVSVGITDDLLSDWDAVELVKIGAEVLGGKGGGGRRDMAQAGGPLGSNSEEALDAIRQFVRSRQAAL